MSEALRRYASTVVVAMVTAAITAAAPAVARTVADYARDANKVDGKHAVGAGADLGKAAGRLVAHDASGQLPDRFVPGMARTALMVPSLDAPVPLGAVDVSYGPPLSITAPEDGFVVVSGNVTYHNSGCTSGCWVKGAIRHLEAGDEAAAYGTITSITDEFGHTTHSHVFAVSAGVNRFDLRVQRGDQGNGTISAWYAELTAIFVPFGPTGGSTLGPSGEGIQP